jgi:hypothetical protein
VAVALAATPLIDGIDRYVFAMTYPTLSKKFIAAAN